MIIPLNPKPLNPQTNTAKFYDHPSAGRDAQEGRELRLQAFQGFRRGIGLKGFGFTGFRAV